MKRSASLLLLIALALALGSCAVVRWAWGEGYRLRGGYYDYDRKQPASLPQE